MHALGSILARLRSRPLAAFLLVYQALFLNVLLPGHTRGAFTLDGKHSADDRPACCCCDARPRPTHGPAVPSERDRAHCAICQFAAGLTSVPPVRLALTPAGLLDVLAVPAPAAVCSLDLVPTYLACGPPPSAAHG